MKDFCFLDGPSDRFAFKEQLGEEKRGGNRLPRSLWPYGPHESPPR
ncbi:hypothetical protein NDA01_30240 [Trichocoleus desertorum AS-A10]